MALAAQYCMDPRQMTSALKEKKQVTGWESEGGCAMLDWLVRQDSLRARFEQRPE